MKRSIIAIFISLAFSACTIEDPFVQKEEKGTSEPGVTITAYIDNGDTKTSYDEETTFSWTKDDYIAVQLYGIKEGDSNYHKYDQYQFKANTSAASSTFTANGSLSTSVWAVNDYAFYPKGDAYGTKTELYYEPGKGSQTVWLYQEITPIASNPMGAIPLIGRKQTAGVVTSNAEFSFKTAVGILKLTVTNIPATARKIKIKSGNGEKLSGYFTFDEDCEIKMENQCSPTYSSYDYKTILFTPEFEGETRSFYFPIPTGTLASGFTVDILPASGDTPLKSISTSKSVTIRRNELLILPEFSGGSEWRYLGKGYYLDNYLFGLATGAKHVDAGGKVGCYVEVVMLKNTSNEKLFRVVKPYETAWNEFGVTASTSNSLTDYLTLQVVKNGDIFGDYETTADRDDLVFFYGNNAKNEVIWAGTEEHNTRFFHYNWQNKTDCSDFTYSKVLSYQADGTTPTSSCI